VCVCLREKEREREREREMKNVGPCREAKRISESTYAA
jgi:hypothetical protein